MRTPDPDNVHRGYIQSWNAAFERRLPFDMSVNAAYVGTSTTRGFANIELNVSPSGRRRGRGGLFVPQFGRTASTTLFGGWNRGRYHSLQMQLNRPFKNGLLLRGAYTLGKTLNMTDDDGTATLRLQRAGGLRAKLRAGRLRSAAHVHAGVHLPVAVRQRQRQTRSLNALVRGWQINGTFAAYSGTPFTVTASNTALDQRGNLQTADLVGDAEERRRRRARQAVLRSRPRWRT